MPKRYYNSQQKSSQQSWVDRTTPVGGQLHRRSIICARLGKQCASDEASTLDVLLPAEVGQKRSDVTAKQG